MCALSLVYSLNLCYLHLKVLLTPRQQPQTKKTLEWGCLNICLVTLSWGILLPTPSCCKELISAYAMMQKSLLQNLRRMLLSHCKIQVGISKKHPGEFQPSGSRGRNATEPRSNYFLSIQVTQQCRITTGTSNKRSHQHQSHFASEGLRGCLASSCRTVRKQCDS